MKKFVILLFCCLLFSSVLAVESNFSRYKPDYLDKNNLVGGVYNAQFDAWESGGESWWLVIPFLVFIAMLYNRSKNEGLVGLSGFFIVIIFNAFFPRIFFVAAALFFSLLFAASVMIAKEAVQ